MATKRQHLGNFGEDLIKKNCYCPKCKRLKTFRKLPNNFKCADLICEFCGFLAQVKTKHVSDVDIIPKKILGGAWNVQKERMDSGIYFPIYLVLLNKTDQSCAVYYLPGDLQYPRHFVPRKPLSATAKRSGWRGFYYDFSRLRDKAFTRIYRSS